MKHLLRFLPHVVLTMLFLPFVHTAYASDVLRSQADQSFYQIEIYHLQDKAQEKRLDQFLEKAYLPAMHQAGIQQVGVFKPVESDTAAGKRVYVLIPLQSLEQLVALSQKLDKDKNYTQNGKDYLEAAYDNPPYTRMESIILQAFPGMPSLKAPNLKSKASQQVYELRSYEGPTERLHQNKIQMFNEGGEIDIFSRLEFNAVFYARVLSGSHMPNLMYMTSFEDMASRDKHWEAFTSDSAWEKLSAKKEYQNNVSHADIFLLHPTSYSDI